MIAVWMGGDDDINIPVKKGHIPTQMFCEYGRVIAAVDQDLPAGGRLDEDGIPLADVQKGYMQIAIRPARQPDHEQDGGDGSAR